MTDAFYHLDGDGFVATPNTRGPWSPKHQHGGPPSALLARGIAAQTPGCSVARVTVDFLLPVPIDRLTMRVETLRAGAKVQRIVGHLLHGDRVVAHALAVLVRLASLAIASPATTRRSRLPSARSRGSSHSSTTPCPTTARWRRGWHAASGGAAGWRRGCASG